MSTKISPTELADFLIYQENNKGTKLTFEQFRKMKATEHCRVGNDGRDDGSSEGKNVEYAVFKKDSGELEWKGYAVSTRDAFGKYVQAKFSKAFVEEDFKTMAMCLVYCRIGGTEQLSNFFKVSAGKEYDNVILFEGVIVSEPEIILLNKKRWTTVIDNLDYQKESHPILQNLISSIIEQREEIEAGMEDFLRDLVAAHKEFLEIEVMNPQPSAKLGKTESGGIQVIEESDLDREIRETQERLARLRAEKEQATGANKGKRPAPHAVQSRKPAAESSAVAEARAAAAKADAQKKPAPMPKPAVSDLASPGIAKATETILKVRSEKSKSGKSTWQLFDGMSKFNQFRWMHFVCGGEFAAQAVYRILPPATPEEITVPSALIRYCKHKVDEAAKEKLFKDCEAQWQRFSSSGMLKEATVELLHKLETEGSSASLEREEFFTRHTNKESQGEGKPRKEVFKTDSDKNLNSIISEGGKKLFAEKFSIAEFAVSFAHASPEKWPKFVKEVKGALPVSFARSEILSLPGCSEKDRVLAFFKQTTIEDSVTELTMMRLIILVRLTLQAVGLFPGFELALKERSDEIKRSKENANKAESSQGSKKKTWKKSSGGRASRSKKGQKKAVNLPYALAPNFVLSGSQKEELDKLGILKGLKDGSRVATVLLISLLQSEGRTQHSFGDVHSQHVALALSNLPPASDSDQKWNEKRNSIESSLKALNEVDVDGFNFVEFVFHNSTFEDPSQTVSKLGMDGFSVGLRLWLFLTAAFICIADEYREEAIRNAVSKALEMARLLPHYPFGSNNLAHTARVVFQHMPLDYDPLTRKIVSYTFDDHVVFKKMDEDDKMKSVNDAAEKRLKDIKTKRLSQLVQAGEKGHSKIKLSRKVYTGDIISDPKKHITTDMIRNCVRRVLGPNNHLERIAKELNDKKIKFNRPHALGILMEMNEHPYLLIQNEEEEAAEMAKFAGSLEEEEEEGNKPGAKGKKEWDVAAFRAKKMVRIINKIKKATMTRKEEDSYGSMEKNELTLDHAKKILKYDSKKNYKSRVGSYGGRTLVKGIGKDVLAKTAATKQDLKEANFYEPGAEFNNYDALALKKIMVDEHLYPPTEFMQVWNDPKKEFKGLEMTVMAKKKIKETMLDIYDEKSVVAQRPGEAIGYTYENYQSPLTMLNLVRTLRGMKVTSYLRLMEASLQTNLGNSSIYMKTMISKLRNRVSNMETDEDMKETVLSQSEAEDIIVRARQRVIKFTKLHNEKAKFIAGGNQGEKQQELSPEDFEDAGLNEDDLASIQEEEERIAENEIDVLVEKPAEAEAPDSADVDEDEDEDEDEEEDEDEDEDEDVEMGDE